MCRCNLYHFKDFIDERMVSLSITPMCFSMFIAQKHSQRYCDYGININEYEHFTNRRHYQFQRIS